MILEDEKAFLRRFPAIEPNSDEWKLIQFKLQLSLGSASATIKSIYDISNTHVSSAFTAMSRGSTTVDSFSSVDTLKGTNKFIKVCQKGYEIAEGGMTFSIGYSLGNVGRSKRQIYCVMNKLYVGKAYVQPVAQYKQNPTPLPEGFDSIYLHYDEDRPQVFRHEYVLFQNAQVFPNYVVEYVVENFKGQQSKVPLCENCNKIPSEPAKIYCITEDAHFCVECDQSYHAPKLASKHERVELNQKPKKFGNCEKHPSQQLQLYCKVCSEPLCINCKIFGDHMAGDFAQHLLIKLKDAFSQISSKVKQIDPNIERRKNQLTEDLSKIDLKVKEVNSKATHIEELLHALFEKALGQLQAQTQRKLSFLIGDQLQIKRQFDQIIWMDSFIKHNLEVQDPYEFLQSWYKYTKYKKEVLSLKNLTINTQVKADMRLEGKLSIVTDMKKERTPQPILDQPNMETNPLSPQKDVRAITTDKELGSTSLRKTIFKKHYQDRMNQTLQDPVTLKGSAMPPWPSSNTRT